MAAKAGQDNVAFQKGAMILMGALVAASVMSVMIQLRREMDRETSRQR